MARFIETLQRGGMNKEAPACGLNLIERALERLHLNSKIVWLYLLAQVRYLDREEVVALGKRLSLHHERGGAPKSLYEFIAQPGEETEDEQDQRAIATLAKRIPKDDLLLNHVCLSYDPPIKPFSVQPQQNGDNGNRTFMRVVDVLAEGSRLLKDLYSLEGLGEVSVRRQLSENQERLWEERFVLTEMGKQHAWVVDLLVQDRLNSYLSKDNFIILTDRYASRVVPKQPC